MSSPAQAHLALGSQARGSVLCSDRFSTMKIIGPCSPNPPEAFGAEDVDRLRGGMDQTRPKVFGLGAFLWLGVTVWLWLTFSRRWTPIARHLSYFLRLKQLTQLDKPHSTIAIIDEEGQTSEWTNTFNGCLVYHPAPSLCEGPFAFKEPLFSAEGSQ